MRRLLSIDAALRTRTPVLSFACEHVGRHIFQTKVDCTCGAEVTIAQYRKHLISRHCNVEGCSERALRTVSFGFRDPQLRIIGVPMGILPQA